MPQVLTEEERLRGYPTRTPEETDAAFAGFFPGVQVAPEVAMGRTAANPYGFPTDEGEPINWDYIRNQMALRDAAMQFEARQEFQRRVQAGEPPEQALRELAPRLFSSGRDIVSAVQPEFEPRRVNLGGTEMLQTGPRAFRAAPREPMPRLNLEQQAQDDILKSRIDALTRQMNTIAGKDFRDASDERALLRIPTEIQAAEAERLKLARTALQAETPVEPPSITPPPVPQPRDRFAAQQEFYNQMAGQVEAPPAEVPPVATPVSSEKVIVTKDGRRYRLPKSQLADAIKEGYKLVE